jgi:hypothetical protein
MYFRALFAPSPRVRDAGDDSLWVSFGMESHFNDVETRAQGRAVFEMKEYIKIIVPGDTTSIIFRPTRPTDYERFPNQYQAFKVGQSQQTGVPLKGWPHITPAQADELAFFKIVTVEQLASVSDVNAQKFPGLIQLRQKAQLYVDQAKSDAPFERVQAELAQRDEKINAQAAEMEMMRQAIAELRAHNAAQAAAEITAEE